MHLGIDRSRFGDIAVEEARAYVFCQQSIVGLITEELTQVRHTQVSCSVCTPSDFSYSPTTLVVRGSIASVRLDSLLSLAFGSSRSSVLPWIEGGIVFVNGKLITTNAHMPREGDIISVRGQGRFRYGKVVAQTKKGRLMAEVEKYI